MYDVTSEESFLNVRSWIESVKVGVNDGCVLCLIGNKCDLHPNAECRTVTYKHGKDLARVKKPIILCKLSISTLRNLICFFSNRVPIQEQA